jgi:hypothetical protein
MEYLTYCCLTLFVLLINTGRPLPLVAEADKWVDLPTMPLDGLLSLEPLLLLSLAGAVVLVSLISLFFDVE